MCKVLGAVSLTYLSILKRGFTPIFSATLSYGKMSVSPLENWRNLSPKFMQMQTIHNFSHSVIIAAAIIFLEDEHRRNRRVFKPRLVNLDILRDFEVKNRYRLTREMIGEIHNLIQADITAQTDHYGNVGETAPRYTNRATNSLIVDLE